MGCIVHAFLLGTTFNTDIAEFMFLSAARIASILTTSSNLDIKTINLCCNLVLMSSIWCCGTTVLDNDVCVSLISSSSPAIVYSRSPEPRK